MSPIINYMGRTTIDLAGQRFGRLLVLERHYPSPTGHALWRCRCDCTGVVTVGSHALRSGGTQSCGCLRREVTAARSTKHGLATRSGRTPTYTAWQNMRRRCRPDHPRYADWGGRGITVCGRWLDDYAAFLADMGEKPPGLTLERRDNSKGYSPGNCYWASPAVQAMNKRSTKLTPIMIERVKALSATGMTMVAIGKQLKLDRHTVSKALWTG